MCRCRLNIPAGASCTTLALPCGRGEILGLVGSSGAGKSTLVLSLLGLLPWRGGRVSGQVLLEGQNLLELPEREFRKLRGSKVAFVPQSPMTALNSSISLRTHFEEAWRAHRTSGRAALMERVIPLLAEVSLPTDGAFLRLRPQQISVGQAQRVLIALALLHQPSLVIADEPTSALDPVTQTQIIDLIELVNRRHGTTFLYISHDLISLLRLSDRVAVLELGRIAEVLPVEDLEDAQHDATLALLRALPVPVSLLLGYHRQRDHFPAEEQFSFSFERDDTKGALRVPECSHYGASSSTGHVRRGTGSFLET